MTIEERYQLLRQLIWDYNIPPEDVDAVLRGQKEMAGHYTREMLFRKLLECFPWFTIIQLFTIEEIKYLLSNNVINTLRFESLRNKYKYVQKRLQ